MNERIRELAERAGLEFDDDLALESEPIYYIKQSDFEKFAKSIIRECADIASDTGTDTVPTDFALDKCYEIEAKILENFGLK